MEEKVTLKRRNNISAQEKVSILRRHLLDKIAVSDLCEEYGIRACQFYQWQKQFFENGTAAFAKEPKRGEQTRTEKEIQALRDKLRRKDEVLSELMEEHVQLKKNLGEI